MRNKKYEGDINPEFYLSTIIDRDEMNNLVGQGIKGHDEIQSAMYFKWINYKMNKKAKYKMRALHKGFSIIIEALK